MSSFNWQSEPAEAKIPNEAKLCETIPSDADVGDWDADGKEITIVPAKMLGNGSQESWEALQTQWISTTENDIEYLEEMR